MSERPIDLVALMQLLDTALELQYKCRPKDPAIEAFESRVRPDQHPSLWYFGTPNGHRFDFRSRGMAVNRVKPEYWNVEWVEDEP